MEISKARIVTPAEVDDEYMCPICVHLLWKPVECQNCQRLFCKQCIDRCLKEKPGICPLCKSYEEKKCSPMFYSLLCKFKIQCENKQNGCNEVLSYELLEKHQAEQCQYQVKTCRDCRKDILKRDLDEHEQMCGEVLIECRRCRLVYKRKEKHEQLDCIMALLEQSNKKIESLENVVQNLQLSIHKHETITNSHSSLIRFMPGTIVHEVPLSSFSSSWNIIYNFPYSHVTTFEELRALRSQCKGKIIVGASDGKSSAILNVAAIGPSDILLLTSPLNQPEICGHVLWYLTPKKSFGFAPLTTTIHCAAADSITTHNSESRLSWYLNGTGGYRAGAVINLNKNNEWRKIIMTEKH